MKRLTLVSVLIVSALGLADTAHGQTYVQSATNAIGNAATTNSATLSATPTAGNTVVVGVDCYGSAGCTISSITDSFNNTYTQIGPTASYGGPTTNITNAALFCASGIASGNSFGVTAHFSETGTGGDSNLYIAEYSGLTCTVDQSASGSLTDGTATTSLQTNSVTTTNANDLLVAIGSATTGGNATPGTGYALRKNGNSGTGEFGGYEDEAISATGSHSGTMSLATTTVNWAMVMVALKGSSGGTPPTVTIFTPTCGPASTSVTITGTNFTGATAVKFNGTAATSFTVNSATQITATVPSGAVTGTVSVTTPSGTGTSSGSFTVGSCSSITYIQSQKNATPSTASQLSATFSATPTAGDTIVVGVDCFGSTNCTTSSITDSAGNSYAQIGPTAGHGGAQNITNVWLYCASGITTGSNFKVTANLTDTGSGGDSDIYIAEYSGVTCGVDQSAAGSLTSGTATTLLQTSAVTTTNASDLLVAIGSASTGNAATAGSGYALRQNDNGGTAEYGGLEDQIVSATGSYSGRMTLAATTTDWAMVMVALKGSSTGGGGAAPTITSFTPTSGPVGTSITITGTNFIGATAVKFNGTAASTFTVTSATQITGAVVPNAATTGPISVTTSPGTGTSTSNFTVLPPAPTVVSFSPTSGPSGTSVTITGTNFTGATAVNFNGIAAQTFSVTSSTQISATVSSADTTGPISVTTPSGTGSSTSNFTVTPTIRDFTPVTGPVGTSVAITGTNFTGATAVTFNGTAAASFTLNSSTQITAVVPATAAGCPRISVATPSGTPTSSACFYVLPVITGISPTVGPGGTPVTITGTGFGSARGSSAVTFNGTQATSFATWDATTISTSVPPGATTGPVVVWVGGIASSGVNFAVQGPNTFSVTGILNTARLNHTATLLNDGTVLMTGGYNGANVGNGAAYFASAERYDPRTGTFTPTGSMNVARAFHTATLLSNGMVLIAGGFDGNNYLSSAELYNPATGTFTPTGSMSAVREAHTATVLSNGMVLMAGGVNSASVLATTELYNPAAGTFTAAVNMSTARYSHTATLLNNGMVLITGGFGSASILATAELYNPATGAFTLTGSMNAARQAHTATLLNNGMVLMAGGGLTLVSAELYNPATGTFTATGSMSVAREAHTATVLSNGTVLIVGGSNSSSILASTELYDPATATFAISGSLNNARQSHTTTLLNNGTVLVAGGSGTSITNRVLTSAELYQPSTLTPPGLVSIAVTPTNASLVVGATQQFLATGTFSNSSTQTLASVTWASSSPIASIANDASNHGNAAAFAVGSTTISACAGSVCGSTAMTVGSNPLGPAITSLLPNYGSVGTTVTVIGTNFGPNLGRGSVTFGNILATPSGSSSTCPVSWSNTCIVVQVPNGVPAGNLNVQVTASGIPSNVANFTDTSSADFLISVTPGSQSASSGSNATYTVKVSPLNGFTGTVSLSVADLPGGATAAFSPTTISGGSGSSTLTVSIPASAPTTASTLLITGTSGSLAHLASAVLLANGPTITGLSLPQGPPQMGFVIKGTNFGATQGSSSVVLGNTNLIVVPGTWSSTSITVQVPAGAVSGNVVVTVAGAASIGVPFTVTAPFSCPAN